MIYAGKHQGNVTESEPREIYGQGQAKQFEMCSLEAYLGDFVGDFDVEAIVDEATVIDYRTGKRCWKGGIDLVEICRKHER